MHKIKLMPKRKRQASDPLVQGNAVRLQKKT
jgi:hypothetical protein